MTTQKQSTVQDQQPRKQDVVDALIRAREQLEKAQAIVDQAVAVARTPDMDGYCILTWEEVGRCIGLSRSGAQARYRGLSWSA